MIIAGPCLFTEINDREEIIETANQLKGIVTHFRCKVFGGGTTPEKYIPGIGRDGMGVLNTINKDIPVGIEVQDDDQIKAAIGLSYIWIGARNSQNYSLLKNAAYFPGELLIKRGAGMTIRETIGLFDIMKKINNRDVYIIERGVLTFDRQDDSRWSPDLKGMVQIKHERPDIFNRIIVDCSHSVGNKMYTGDVYTSFKSIGINNFMFECMAHPEFSKTDKNQILSVEELRQIIL